MTLTEQEGDRKVGSDAKRNFWSGLKILNACFTDFFTVYVCR